jgi:type IX secretion system PorP/SprF family membrane protein
MKIKYHLSISIAFVFIFSGCLFGQQLPYRSPLGSTDFMYNPGLTAVEDFMEFGAFHRQQWLGFNGAPSTSQAFIHVPVIYRKLSIGGFLQHDQIGPFTTNSLALTYAYKTKLGLRDDDQISFGLSSSYQQYTYSASKAVVADGGDPLATEDFRNVGRFNAGFGIVYTSNARFDYDDTWFYFGLAANQLIQSKIPLLSNTLGNFNRVLAGNAFFGFRKPFNYSYLEPSVWVHFSQPNLMSYSLNLTYEIEDAFWTGVSYGSTGQASAQAGFILKDGFLQDGKLRIGLLGSYNVLRLANSNSFGVECVLGYRFEL